MSSEPRRDTLSGFATRSLRLWGRARRFTRALVAHPGESASALYEDLVARHDRPELLSVDESWEEHLHSFLGAPWPCPVGSLVTAIWSAIPGEFQSYGLAFGRGTYGGYSDGDLSFARASWCSVLHLRPSVVLETGVARGVTSRIILEALAERSGSPLEHRPASPVRLESPRANWGSGSRRAQIRGGPTYRGRAESACPPYFDLLGTWTSFSMTACTRLETLGMR